MNVADTLRAIRAKFEMNQTQLANRLKVAFISVNRWESQQAAPRENGIIAINKLAAEVGLPPVDLRPPAPKKQKSPVQRVAKARNGNGHAPAKQSKAPARFSPEQAAKCLAMYASTPSGRGLSEPITALIEHVKDLELALNHIETGVLTALRGKPNNAVVGTLLFKS